jgi:hypothetical protein
VSRNRRAYAIVVNMVQARHIKAAYPFLPFQGCFTNFYNHAALCPRKPSFNVHVDFFHKNKR